MIEKENEHAARTPLPGGRAHSVPLHWLFFPAAVLVYYLTPAKRRYLMLGLISYGFYMCFRPVYALLLFGVTLVTYLAGSGDYFKLSK